MRSITVTLYPSDASGEDLTLITPSAEFLAHIEEAKADSWSGSANLSVLDHLMDIEKWAARKYEEVFNASRT